MQAMYLVSVVALQQGTTSNSLSNQALLFDTMDLPKIYVTASALSDQWAMTFGV